MTTRSTPTTAMTGGAIRVPREAGSSIAFWKLTAFILGGHLLAWVALGGLARGTGSLLAAMAGVDVLPFEGFTGHTTPLEGMQWGSLFLVTATAALLAYAFAKQSQGAIIAAGVAILVYELRALYCLVLIF